MTNKCVQGTYFDESAIILQTSKYEAVVLPNVGANLIAFRDTELKYHFLREPKSNEMDKFRAFPVVYGIPVLFPPNRFEDGKIPWNGEVYQFPINEPDKGNHLHGFACNTPWEVVSFDADSTASRVTLALKVTKEHPIHTYFPHSFTIKLSYHLSDEGLQQHVMIKNDGEKRMPCMIGFHTAINAPFAANSSMDQYKFKLTIGERWQLNERSLPTGAYQPLTSEEQKMKTGDLSPYFAPMDNHYTAQPQDGRNRMELTDENNHIKLVYDVGTAFKHWMVWNSGNRKGFFCPEPQTILVNAPNTSLPAEQIGLAGLEKGELWEASSRLYCIDLT